LRDRVGRFGRPTGCPSAPAESGSRTPRPTVVAVGGIAPRVTVMSKLDRVTAAVAVVLGGLGGAAAWFDFSWITLVLGWAGGILAGGFRIERKSNG
jgi:hypothetical protein